MDTAITIRSEDRFDDLQHYDHEDLNYCSLTNASEEGVDSPPTGLTPIVVGHRTPQMSVTMEHEKRMRREIANSNERRRMQSINAGFQNLRTLIPHHEGEKLSKSWRDQKTKTSKKVSALRSARVETGNKKNNLPQLSDLDTKVLSIIGNDYVAGTSCPESWPEEQENNVQRMALGDESIYLAEPRSLNVGIDEENINQGDNIDADLENIEYETISCSFINENDISTAHIASQLIDKVTNDRKVTSSKRPRMVKQKLSAQLQTARNSFNGIAEKQADAMTLMADSLSVIGKALNTMADNDAKRNENDMKMIALYDKILQKL